MRRDTGRSQPSAGQTEKPGKRPSLPALRRDRHRPHPISDVQTSGLGDRKFLLFKPQGFSSFVMTALANKYNEGQREISGLLRRLQH